MGWADKELKKHKIRKLVEQAMRDPKYEEERKEMFYDYYVRSLNAFLLISVDFMHRKLGFCQKRIMKFLEFALAVSSDARGADNIVSIIILSQNPSVECVQIVNSQFAEGILYCNCGKVTCTERNRLIREIAKVNDKKMHKIDMMIANALGINPVEVVAENKVYKELYLELLERVIGERDGKTHHNED